MKIQKLKSKIQKLERVHSLMDVCRNNDNLTTPELFAVADVLMVAQNQLFQITKSYEKKLRKLEGGAK